MIANPDTKKARVPRALAFTAMTHLCWRDTLAGRCEESVLPVGNLGVGHEVRGQVQIILHIPATLAPCSSFSLIPVHVLVLARLSIVPLTKKQQHHQLLGQ